MGNKICINMDKWINRLDTFQKKSYNISNSIHSECVFSNTVIDFALYTYQKHYSKVWKVMCDFGRLDLQHRFAGYAMNLKEE